jgi:hypothetical protein
VVFGPQENKDQRFEEKLIEEDSSSSGYLKKLKDSPIGFSIDHYLSINTRVNQI